MQVRIVKTLKTSLPLLNAMVVFEAAARHGGLTLAAQELNIAQPAVSRHVANLERQLSVELFTRKGNRVAVTGAGNTLAEAIREGLGTIRQAVEDLTAHDSDTFVVGCSHDFAQAWLMPRFDLITSRVATTGCFCRHPPITGISTSPKWRCRSVSAKPGNGPNSWPTNCSTANGSRFAHRRSWRVTRRSPRRTPRLSWRCRCCTR